VNLIVDTNIVFSTLLNPHSAIGEILMNVQDEFKFFAPELLKDELKRYNQKLVAYSKLDSKTLSDIETLVLTTINFVSEASISEQSWIQAFALTKDIDEDDTPFIALGIELNAKLWTGDKVLSKGLAKKGVDLIVTTSDLKKLIS
jgi:predicted nucleic acid-binding protein